MPRAQVHFDSGTSSARCESNIAINPNTRLQIVRLRKGSLGTNGTAAERHWGHMSGAEESQ
jgi:hypothetical protein